GKEIRRLRKQAEKVAGNLKGRSGEGNCRLRKKDCGPGEESCRPRTAVSREKWGFDQPVQASLVRWPASRQTGVTLRKKSRRKPGGQRGHLGKYRSFGSFAVRG